jgi:hypothetical protein
MVITEPNKLAAEVHDQMPSSRSKDFGQRRSICPLSDGGRHTVSSCLQPSRQENWRLNPLFGAYAQILYDDFPHPLADITHRLTMVINDSCFHAVITSPHK